MVNQEHLRVLISADVKKLNAGLNKASNQLSNFGSRLNTIGKNLSLKLTAPILAAGTMAVKSASDFQRLRTTLEVLTGSADKGRKVFEKLVKFSARTPFQLPDLVNVNNMLMGFGLNADQAYESLKLLGDIAAVSGGSLENIARAFGQSAGAGRVMTQDINQFINNAVPLYGMLSDVTGKNTGQLREMASQGEITFELLIKAFRNATAEGGKFNNGMERLSQTFGGQLSTFRDQLNITFAKFGEIILPLLTRMLKKLSSLADRLKNLSPETRKLTLIFGGLLSSLGPLSILIGSMSKGLGIMLKGFKSILTIVPLITRSFYSLGAAIAANPIGLLVTAVTALGVALIEVLHRMNPLVDRMTTFLNVIKSAGNPAKFFALQAETIAKNEHNATKQQIKLNKEIKDFKKSVDQTIPEIDVFADAFKGMGNEADNVRQKVEPVNEIMKTFEFDGKKAVFGIGVIGQKVKVAEDAFKDLKKTSTEVSKKIYVDFSGIALAGAQAFGTALVEGGNVFKAIGKIILQSLGDILIQMGTAAVLASKLATTFAIPIVGVAAGLAAIAAGAVLKGLAGKMQNEGPRAFADGGIVSGPTMGLIGEYTGARSNPEVVAPLDRLNSMINNGGSNNVNVTGEFRLKGQDLVVALQRANKQRNRIL